MRDSSLSPVVRDIAREIKGVPRDRMIPVAIATFLREMEPGPNSRYLANLIERERIPLPEENERA